VVVREESTKRPQITKLILYSDSRERKGGEGGREGGMSEKDVPDHGLDALDKLGVLLVGGEGTRANGAHDVVVVDRLLLLEKKGRKGGRKGGKGE